jgi:hypothetical protein
LIAGPVAEDEAVDGNSVVLQFGSWIEHFQSLRYQCHSHKLANANIDRANDNALASLTTCMNMTGTVAVKVTVEANTLPVLVTVLVRLVTVRPVIPFILPLKTLLASVTAAVTEPSPLIAAAAVKPGDFCEIEATLAASAAANGTAAR